MKQLIFSTGVFETDFKFEPMEFVSDDRPGWRTVRRPEYELRKVSRCLIRYELENEDKDFIQKLDRIIDNARNRLHNGTLAISDYQLLAEKRDQFAKIYDKAVSGYTEEYRGLMYIEIADSSSQGCRAMYRYDDNGIEWEKPCKIGEPLTSKFDFNKFEFEPIKIY